jgi:hypothetical protein
MKFLRAPKSAARGKEIRNGECSTTTVFLSFTIKWKYATTKATATAPYIISNPVTNERPLAERV